MECRVKDAEEKSQSDRDEFEVAGGSANNANSSEQEREIEINSSERLAHSREEKKEEEMTEEEKIDIGPCLMIRASLDGKTNVLVIIDSGAGVTIVGKRFLTKWESVMGKSLKIKPIDLKITGVYSTLALSASGVTSFEIRFLKEHRRVTICAS